MKKRGRGVGVMWYPTHPVGPNPSSAFCKINSDGTLVVQAGAKDVGQGSTTALAQVAAATLGVPLEWVSMVTADTDLTPFDGGSTGSRVTYVASRAIELAVGQAKKPLLEVASERLGVPVGDLESGNGKVWVRGDESRSMGISAAAAECYGKKAIVPVGAASYAVPLARPDLETGQAEGKAYPSYIYATHIAEVEVDTETGEVEVLRFVAAHDSGTVVNPLLTHGQICGGVAMGIGLALTEQMLFKDGRVLNPNFMDYVVPTALDVPDIEVIHCETPDPTSTFGVKAVGEASIVPTAPAVINAIYDAVGVRIYDLPATPEKILRALKSAQPAE
jgi:nicotinate dehydrogenase medium molybdopterin subunit